MRKRSHILAMVAIVLSTVAAGVDSDPQHFGVTTLPTRIVDPSGGSSYLWIAASAEPPPCIGLVTKISYIPGSEPELERFSDAAIIALDPRGFEMVFGNSDRLSILPGLRELPDLQKENDIQGVWRLTQEALERGKREGVSR